MRIASLFLSVVEVLDSFDGDHRYALVGFHRGFDNVLD
jgi:hypothetical protein